MSDEKDRPMIAPKLTPIATYKLQLDKPQERESKITPEVLNECLRIAFFDPDKDLIKQLFKLGANDYRYVLANTVNWSDQEFHKHFIKQCPDIRCALSFALCTDDIPLIDSLLQKEPLDQEILNWAARAHLDTLKYIVSKTKDIHQYLPGMLKSCSPYNLKYLLSLIPHRETPHRETPQ